MGPKVSRSSLNEEDEYNELKRKESSVVEVDLLDKRRDSTYNDIIRLRWWMAIETPERNGIVRSTRRSGLLGTCTLLFCYLV